MYSLSNYYQFTQRSFHGSRKKEEEEKKKEEDGRKKRTVKQTKTNKQTNKPALLP